MFQVENFLQEKYPSISAKPMRYKALVGVLRYLLHETEFEEFGQNYPYLEGIDFVEKVLEYFNFSYSVSNTDREKIPSQGKAVIVANHPIGSLDGLALIKLVYDIRSDVKIVANDLLMSLKPLRKLLLPVNNMGGRTPKENLNEINEHLNSEGVVIIFPAGEVSRMALAGIRDGHWKTGFLRIAAAAKAPILPIYLDARNSILFYLTSIIYKPMATVLLVKEMFKQATKTVGVKIGNPIPFKNFDNLPFDNRHIAGLFRKHVYSVGLKKRPIFESETPIAHPEKSAEVYEHLSKHDRIGETPDGKQIFLCQNLSDSPILREIGRLREFSFRTVGEGTGFKRDTDQYDRYYFHLVLWDNKALEIVGAYRFCDAAKVISEKGLDGLYTNSLFEFGSNMESYLSQSLELGRSFVQPKYWGKRSLDYLWYGIGAFLKRNPQYRYLFGPVSISDQLPQRAKDLLVYFYSLYFSENSLNAHSYNPYVFDDELSKQLKTNFTGNDYKKDFVELKSLLGNLGVSVPTLYKQYTELCEEGGVKFLDFGRDPEFAGCVDGLVLVDTHLLKEKKKKRYLA
ncbi:MAG: lysophospholipid acyltransferase family protein [Gammaproteobacteria bacterium]|nr:lysophospholipid acyltransferase family protein [Gammaproteobacteria bacterium]